MGCLLDTNICIYLIKQRPPQVKAQFAKVSMGEIGISSITVAELQYGIAKSKAMVKNQQALNQFIAALEIHPFDHSAAARYGQNRAYLEREGMPIGSLDMLIAAHALSLNATLVTNNEREFRRAPNLEVENWV